MFAEPWNDIQSDFRPHWISLKGLTTPIVPYASSPDLSTFEVDPNELHHVQTFTEFQITSVNFRTKVNCVESRVQY